MSKDKYTKLPLTFEQQLELLQKRGLIISDKEFAINFLSRVNYYRFSAYYIPFEKSRHIFNLDTKITDIQKLYEFDTKLRSLLTKALEIIEIGLRTSVAYHLSNEYGAFAHENNTIFFQNRAFDFETWQEKLHGEIKRSQEKFIKHYKYKYEGFPVIPLWMAVEVMTFGSLSRMVSALNRKDQVEISKKYNIHYKVLCSWLHSLTYTRNICAHHSRIWDRTLSIKIIVPKKAEWKNVDPENITSIVYLILYFFNKMKVNKRQVEHWRNRYTDLVLSAAKNLQTHSKINKLVAISQSDLWAKYCM